MSTDCYWVQDGEGNETGSVCVCVGEVLVNPVTYICCQIPCDDAGPAPICYWAGVQLGDS